MLTWALAFFVVAILAGVVGFGGISGAAADVAKLVFFVSLVLLAIALLTDAVRGRAPRV